MDWYFLIVLVLYFISVIAYIAALHVVGRLDTKTEALNLGWYLGLACAAAINHLPRFLTGATP